MILAMETALCLFTELPGTAAEPATLDTGAAHRPAHPMSIPPQYGKIIYQRNGSSMHHLYIVGGSHRSALTGRNGHNTVRAQIEVYRIGEWLIRNEGVQLVLPEGFFKRRPDGIKSAAIRLAAPRPPHIDGNTAVDDTVLEQRLADDAVFMSAEMLLKAHHDIHIQQVEDERIYAAVGEFLRLTERLRDSAYIPLFFHMELERMQESRTLAMLQNIPKAIDKALSQGHISNRRALFTIGMNHIDDILRYLKNDGVSLPSLPTGAAADNDRSTELKLLSEAYGVTVILPRVLAEDKEALRLTKLDDI